MKLNPKVSEFLESYPEMTVAGLAWAIFWRMYAIIIAATMVIAFLDGFFDAL